MCHEPSRYRVDVDSRCQSNSFTSESTSFVVDPGVRSGIPEPRSTGLTANSTVSASPHSATYETAPATEKPDIPTAFRFGCRDDLPGIIVDDADTRIGVSRRVRSP